MNISKKFILVSSLPFLLAACADESPFEDTTKRGEGKITLSLTSSSEVKTSIPHFRSETTEIVVPPVSLFQIRLSKTDGSYAKTWSNIDEFAKETEFSIGQYSLEAYYGTPDSQGFIKPSEKGYEHAYYYGITENIMVLENQETPVKINASLANSLVWVEYTDAFKNFFRSWNTILKTSGKGDVELGSEEGKSYVSPGKVDIVMDAVLENGNPVFLNPAEFDAEAQHMYKITYDIFNGDNGNAILSVKFNDDPEATHDIPVELSDEVVSAGVPVVSLVGFESSQIFETQAGTPFNNDVKYEVLAKGGIAKAILKISSDTYSSSFLDNGQIDLCSATAEQQKAIEKAGIKARGFFSNPEKMAFLDMNDFCNNLPAGIHEISLMVTDQNQHTNDPETPTVKIISVNTNSVITKTESIFGNNYADITVEYDGPDPTKNGVNPFSFKFVIPRTGLEYPVEIKAIGTETNSLTRAIYQSHIYVFRVGLPEEAADSYPLRMYFNGSSNPVDDSHTVDIIYPDYTVEYDAFAKWMRLRVAGIENDVNKKKLFTERLRVFVDGNEIENVSKDIQTGIISFEGLTPDKDYNLKTSLQISKIPQIFSETSRIHMEAEIDVPNGDFTNFDEDKKIEINAINIGSEYTVKVLFGGEYQNKTSIIREVPMGWGTLNNETCDLNSSNKNTWYLVPSTFIESFSDSQNNYCTIRSVAYSHDGENLSASTGGKWQGQGNTNYYGETTPNLNNLDKSIGELSLGNRENFDGIEFMSRPSKLVFDYSYMCYNQDNQLPEENGYVEIIIKDSNKKVLAKEVKKLECTSKWSLDSNNLPFLEDPITKMKIELSSYEFGSKAAYLKIIFKSKFNEGTPNIYMPTGELLSEGLHANELKKDGNCYLNSADRNRPANSYHAFCMGSELKVANVHFEY